MAVSIAVVPGLFMLIFQSGGRQGIDGPFQIFHHSGFEFYGGDRPGGSHHCGAKIPVFNIRCFDSLLKFRCNVKQIRTGFQFNVNSVGKYYHRFHSCPPSISKIEPKECPSINEDFCLRSRHAKKITTPLKYRDKPAYV